jgi:hypothetical protein
MRWLFQSAAVGLLTLVGTQPGYTQSNQNDQGTENVGAQIGTNPATQGTRPGDGGNPPVRPSGTNRPGENQTGGQPPGSDLPHEDAPWFTDERLRDELDLNEEQIERLARAYNQTWSELRNGDRLDDLSAEARAERLREARERFDDAFSRRTTDIFRDENQRNRFNQLRLQHQGYSAFDDPRLRRELNINETQLRQLQDLNNSWNTELDALRGTYAGDRTGTEQRFNQLRDRTSTNFEGILNDQQRTAYDEMIGNRFDFGPSSYLEANLDHHRAVQENTGGSGLGTALNPGGGSGLLTPQNPGGGSGLLTPQNPGTGSGAGAGTDSGSGAGTGTGGGSGTGSGGGSGS